MRTLDYYIKELETKTYLTSDDLSAITKDLYSYFVSLYEESKNPMYATEKRMELIETYFIKSFSIDSVDYTDKEDIITLVNLKRAIIKYIEEAIQHKSTVFYNSLFFHFRHMCTDIFYPHELAFLDKLDKDNYKRIEKTYALLMANATDISDFDLDLLYTYLKNNIDSKNEDLTLMCDDCFEKLVKDNKKLTKYELSFVINYLCKKDWDLDEERPQIYLSSFDGSRRGESSSKTPNILISYDIYKDKTIIDHELNVEPENVEYVYCLAKTVFHEIQHQRQRAIMDRGYLSLTAFYYLCRTLLSEAFEKENDINQKTNYVYKEIETQANAIASEKCYRLAKTFDLESQDVYNKMFESYNGKFSKSVQSDLEGNISDVISYNINKLQELIKKYPTLYDYHPTLKVIFDDNLEVMNIGKFIKNYNKLLSKDDKPNAKRLYNYLFKYYIYNRNKLGIDLNSIKFDSLDEKMTYMIMLEDYILSELRSLEYIFTTLKEYDLQREDELIKILYDKVDNLNEVYNVIKNNKVIEIIDMILPSADYTLSFGKKAKKFMKVFNEMKKCNLLRVVEDNPVVKDNMRIKAVARRVDMIEDSYFKTNQRRKVVSAKKKAIDYSNSIKR